MQIIGLFTPPDEPSTNNLLYDDHCPDMELILLNSSALKKTLRHTFYKYEIEQIHEFAEKLKEESLRLAAELGYFRLLNHIENCGLNFKDVFALKILLIDIHWNLTKICLRGG